MTLTIKHPGMPSTILHKDVVHARSLSAALKKIDLSNEEICDLKNYGITTWADEYGALHTLEMKHEVN